MHRNIPFFLTAFLGTFFIMTHASADNYQIERDRMIKTQIRSRGVKDKNVLAAMQAVPRHEFVLAEYNTEAYADYPLPIGYQQTISQPYIVAYMTELMDVDAASTVLEVGTGSGYQAAVLAHIVKDVYSIEIIPELAERARKTLTRLGYTNVNVKTGDGYLGWPEHAPYDAIIVTAAADTIPQPLIQQLKKGGRMVMPVAAGIGYQMLEVITKDRQGVVKESDTIPVRFVPLVREKK